MQLDAQFLYGLAYAFFIVIMEFIIVAAVVWRKFKNFLIEELETRLVSPLQQKVDDHTERLDKYDRKLEDMEKRQLENQQGTQQKFETIIRDIADLKGRLEGMLGKFDLYLKMGGAYGKEHQ